jgi:hypothetical protein
MAAAGAPRNLLEVIHAIGRLSEAVDEPNEVIRAVLREIIPVQIAEQLESAQRRAA